MPVETPVEPAIVDSPLGQKLLNAMANSPGESDPQDRPTEPTAPAAETPATPAPETPAPQPEAQQPAKQNEQLWDRQLQQFQQLNAALEQKTAAIDQLLGQVRKQGEATPEQAQKIAKEQAKIEGIKDRIKAINPEEFVEGKTFNAMVEETAKVQGDQDSLRKETQELRQQVASMQAAQQEAAYYQKFDREFPALAGRGPELADALSKRLDELGLQTADARTGGAKVLWPQLLQHAASTVKPATPAPETPATPSAPATTPRNIVHPKATNTASASATQITQRGSGNTPADAATKGKRFTPERALEIIAKGVAESTD